MIKLVFWLKKLLNFLHNNYKSILAILFILILFFLWDSNNTKKNNEKVDNLLKQNETILKEIQVGRDSMISAINEARNTLQKDSIYKIEIKNIENKLYEEISNFNSLPVDGQIIVFQQLADEYISTGFNQDSL